MWVCAEPGLPKLTGRRDGEVLECPAPCPWVRLGAAVGRQMEVC